MYLALADELLEGEGTIKRVRGSKITIEAGGVGRPDASYDNGI